MRNPQTILIIDDNPDIRDVLRICLRPQRFQIIEAENGATGLELALRRIPSVILCDEFMPQVDGAETLARLKRVLSTAHIPVIMIGGTTNLDEREWLRRGAFGVLHKPFEFHELLAIVRRAIEETSAQQAK